MLYRILRIIGLSLAVTTLLAACGNGAVARGAPMCFGREEQTLEVFTIWRASPDRSQRVSIRIA